MVSQHPQPERMSMRLTPSAPSNPVPSGSSVEVPKFSFNIEIPGADGTMLLRLFERDGRLCAEGDETRWDEAARRFVYQMLQWSGQIPVRWKDEARKAVEG